MRLKHVLVRNRRVVRSCGTPLEGMTVLVGPNAVGKTTVLSGIETALDFGVHTTDSVVRLELDDEEEPSVQGVVATLDALNVGQIPAEPPWFFAIDGCFECACALVSDLKEVLVDAEADDALAVLSAELVSRGTAGDVEDRIAIAREVLDSKRLLVHQGVVYKALIPATCEPAILEAASRFEATGADSVDGDLIAMWCEALTLGYPAALPVATVDQFPLPEPEVVWLDTSVEHLNDLAASILVEAHDRLYSHFGKLHMPDLVLVGLEVSFSEVNQVDAWLEVLSSDPELEQTPDGPDTPSQDLEALVRLAERGEDLSSSIPDHLMRKEIRIDGQALASITRHSSTDWFRVKPTLVKVAEILAHKANEIAPSFIQDHGAISLNVRPPSRWLMDDFGSRIEIGLLETDGRYRRVDELSEGLQRWIAATFQLLKARVAVSDCAFTESALGEIQRRQGVTGSLGGDFEASIDDLNEVIDTARADPFGKELVLLDLDGFAPDRVWLVDEPEAHLHVRAVRSVAQWLLERSHESCAVIIGTHDNSFLEIDSQTARVLVGRRSDGSSTFARLGDRSLSAVQDVGRELGLSTAQVLGLTKLILFVEGPHDQAVLSEFIGEELDRQGVVVIPMHGTKTGLTGLIDSELVAALGLPIGILTDETHPERLTDRAATTRTERDVVRLAQEARAAGRTIHTFGLRRKDIVDYLDDEVCTAAAPDFPGWTQAVAAWKDAQMPKPFKTWVSATYGLRLDRRSVRSLAAATKAANRVPKEFLRLTREIVAAANA